MELEVLRVSETFYSYAILELYKKQIYWHVPYLYTTQKCKLLLPVYETCQVFSTKNQTTKEES